MTRLAMHGAAGFLVLVIEGTAVLINHDSVLLERTEAVTVKLLGKKSSGMTEGIDRVIDNQIILINLRAQKAQAVGIKNRYARIVESDRVIGEKFATGIDKDVIRFHDVDLLDLRIARKLARHATVTAADNQYLAHMRMHRHGNVDDHLVINELVLL